MATISESNLYLPVKRYLETPGFEVKGEISGCDLVALRGNGPPIVIIGELKLSFAFELLLQGIDRASAGDEVWLAVWLRNPARDENTIGVFANFAECRVLVC